MSFLYRLNKPEYILQPKKLVQRLLDPKVPEKMTTLKMPWGLELEVNPQEVIGKSIYTLGVYEVALSELVWRSLQHVDDFIDVGANIGYFSSLASGQKSFTGKIHSFEPHPKIRTFLTNNTQKWDIKDRLTVHECALSDSCGETQLHIPKDFDNNEGIATLCAIEDGEYDTHIVKTDTLDNLFDDGKSYSIKIDTEGHEASVLKGGHKLLTSGKARVVFFEEFKDYPCETFSLLEDHDYTIFRIERGLFGPILKKPTEPQKGRQWEPVNFIAIKKGDKTLQDYLAKGWSVL